MKRCISYIFEQSTWHWSGIWLNTLRQQIGTYSKGVYWYHCSKRVFCCWLFHRFQDTLFLTINTIHCGQQVRLLLAWWRSGILRVHTISEIGNGVDKTSNIGCEVIILSFIRTSSVMFRKTQKQTISQNLLRYGLLGVFSFNNGGWDYLVAEVICPHADIPSTYGQLKNVIITKKASVRCCLMRLSFQGGIDHVPFSYWDAKDAIPHKRLPIAARWISARAVPSKTIAGLIVVW